MYFDYIFLILYDKIKYYFSSAYFSIHNFAALIIFIYHNSLILLQIKIVFYPLHRTSSFQQIFESFNQQKNRLMVLQCFFLNRKHFVGLENCIHFTIEWKQIANGNF